MSHQSNSLYGPASNNEDPNLEEHHTYSMDNLEESSTENSLVKVEINLGNNNVKELNIHSMNDIEKEIDDFCRENNLPKETKIPIKNLLLEELNKKIKKCKPYFL